MPRRTPPSRLTDIAEAARQGVHRQGLPTDPDDRRGQGAGTQPCLALQVRRKQRGALPAGSFLHHLPGQTLRTPEPAADTVTGSGAQAPGRLDRGQLHVSLVDGRTGHRRLPRHPTGVRRGRRRVLLHHRGQSGPPGSARAIGHRFPRAQGVVLRKARRGQVDLLAEYVERRSRSGLLRPFPDPTLATQLVIETVAWFAWHRRDHPAPIEVDDGAARQSVLYLLAAACIPDDVQDAKTGPG